MKVKVYTKSGNLIEEFGTNPYDSSSYETGRSVKACNRLSETHYQLEFDDDLLPRHGFIHGEVIVVTY